MFLLNYLVSDDLGRPWRSFQLLKTLISMSRNVRCLFAMKWLANLP